MDTLFLKHGNWKFLELVNSVAIGKPEQHVSKASHCGNKQQ